MMSSLVVLLSGTPANVGLKSLPLFMSNVIAYVGKYTVVNIIYEEGVYIF